MDAMVDATELWSLDAYAGVPRINPQFPIVNMDDPDIICFQVPEEHKIGRNTQTMATKVSDYFTSSDVTKPLMIIDDKVASKNIIANDSLQSSCESSAKNLKWPPAQFTFGAPNESEEAMAVDGD
uniref:Uncharacterized protein n=1 Tax=Oryza punctata TaxID=4537 RepID=A0A0E0MD11_ORYPU